MLVVLHRWTALLARRRKWRAWRAFFAGADQNRVHKPLRVPATEFVFQWEQVGEANSGLHTGLLLVNGCKFQVSGIMGIMGNSMVVAVQSFANEVQPLGSWAVVFRSQYITSIKRNDFLEPEAQKKKKKRLDVGDENYRNTLVGLCMLVMSCGACLARVKTGPHN